MTKLRISHNRWFDLFEGIKNENLEWYVADRETGDVVLLFENSGDELLFLLRWS